jgi:squalene-hopene/tetraprenyl-beta-curcumene cyclase
LFAGAFPGVGEKELGDMSLVAFLFANVLVTADNIVDGDWVDPLAGPVHMMANQFEAYRVLARLFAGDSPFWDIMQASIVEYATTVAEQRRFAGGERTLREFTAATAMNWAKAKASLAKVTVAGLGELAGDRRPVPALTRSIQAYCVAVQMLDDVLDWRADLTNRRPSYPLARAVAAAAVREPAPGRSWTAEQTERVGRAMYLDGVVTDTLELAAEQLAEAQAACSGLGTPEWLSHLNAVNAKIRLIRAEVSDAVAGPRLKGVSIRIALDRGRPWQPLAYRNLRWLLGQWRLGFPDATHFMAFPGHADPGPHAGNIFSRALIANALTEADQTLARGQLAPCLATEGEFLVAQRRIDEPGLWSYFPGLAELPCDADDLAEALRLLTRTGQATALAQELTTALSLALYEGARPDGSFDTWLVPGTNPKPQWLAQRAAVKNSWGEGTDPEVVANLSHAVAEYDLPTHRGALDRATNYLVKTQTAGGCWPSGWYHGWLYSTYQCIRTISVLRPTATDTIRRSQERILATQLPDGGWPNSGDTGTGDTTTPDTSAGDASDPIGTALAILTLAHAHPFGLLDTHHVQHAASRARQWLADNVDADGSYPPQPFILMSPKRSPGVGAELTFGSRSITTALVCQAATVWDRLS